MQTSTIPFLALLVLELSPIPRMASIDFFKPGTYSESLAAFIGEPWFVVCT
jgi:hypothetical protein